MFETLERIDMIKALFLKMKNKQHCLNPSLPLIKANFHASAPGNIPVNSQNVGFIRTPVTTRCLYRCNTDIVFVFFLAQCLLCTTLKSARYVCYMSQAAR